MDKENAKKVEQQTEKVEFEVVDDIATPGAKAVEQGNEGGETPVEGGTDGVTVSNNVDKVSAEKLSKLKDGKMTFAKNLIELAKTSTVAQDKVREMIENDIGTSDYLKAKFPDVYTSIISGNKVEESAGKINLVEIEEKARVKAKLELYKEQLEMSNTQAMKAKAVELGFTTEEYSVFESNVKALGIDRLEDAALLVNRDKFLAQSKTPYNPVSSGTQAPTPPSNTGTVKFSRKFAEMAQRSGQDLNSLAANKIKFDKMSDGDTLILEGLID